MDSFYQNFSYLFANHWKLHSRRYYVFAEREVFWISALQMSGKSRNRFESLLGVWTNPVYKASWASLPAKQAVTVGFS